METKKCKNCKQTFTIDQFRSWKANRRGRTDIRVSPRCIECDREYDKGQTKRRDKEKVRLAGIKYRATDKGKKKAEEIKEKNRIYSRKVYFRKCKCGKVDVLKRKPERLGLCDNCKAKTNYDTIRATKQSTCLDCGVLFDGFKGVKRCDNCKKEHIKKQKRKARKLRRAKERGARAGVAFDPIDVFKRDKWKCKMCNCRVQKKDIYKDNAADLDHIIPLSKGGLHVPSNVQTLCRACNSNKSNKLIGQASLFGRRMF